MAMTLDAREERRRNVKAFAIAGGILVVCALFAYRPATVIGVDGEALAVSMGSSSVLGKDSNCVELGVRRWRCDLNFGSYGATATVETKAFGCWEVIAAPPDRFGAVTDSGCITALDFVFAQ
jgi:hypothetical protein